LRANDAEADALQEASQKATALQEKDGAFQAAQASAGEAQKQLLQALRNQARAERVSGRPGQRFAALKAIRQAAATRVKPALRTEAIGALARPDVEIAQEWDGFPEGALSLAFDADLQRLARLNRDGTVTICRRSENGERVIAQLRAHGEPPFSSVW